MFYKEEIEGIKHYRPISGGGDKVDNIDAGLYIPKVEFTMMGPVVVGLQTSGYFNDPGIIKFKSGVINSTINKIQRFLSPKNVEIHKHLKVSMKLGCILYGPPGTGKTTLANLILQECVDKFDAIAVDITGQDVQQVWNILKEIRSRSSKLIITFFDEFEHIANLNSLLPILDGNNSIENSVFIGATNFIDKIPDRIKNRPSRIKYRIEVNKSPVEVFKQYYTEKTQDLPKEYQLSDKDQFELLAKCDEDSLTIDQFKQTLLTMLLYGIPYEKAVAPLKGINLIEELDEGYDD